MSSDIGRHSDGRHSVARRAVNGLTAGLTGTTAMTAGLKLEQRLRRKSRGIVDYDASGHVVTAAATVIRYEPRTPSGRSALFALVHWGYGSAVAVGYPALRACLPRPVALLAFYTGCQAMAMTLFPTIGGTPPPWRWRHSVLISSLMQHALYAVTVDIAYQAAAELDSRAS